MGFLVYPLGTSDVEPADGEMAATMPRYYRQHPGDSYGDVLVVACEFVPDTPAAKVRLPADGQPQ